MAYYDYDSDLDEDSSSNLVKHLRKTAKDKDKELQELKSKFESLNKAQRERTIKDVLESRGVNSKIASFIPKDIEPTEESVSKWLEDNADVFGAQTSPKLVTPNIDPNDAAAYKRMNNTTDSGSSPEHNADIMQRLMRANTKEELNEVIRLSGV